MKKLLISTSNAAQATELSYPLKPFADGDAFELACRELYQSGWGHEGDPRQNDENEKAQQMGASLLFGEILPKGVSKIMDAEHLDAAHATTLVDLGCGMGKLVLQCFLEYPNLNNVIGIELCQSRYALGAQSLTSLSANNPDTYSYVTNETHLQLTENPNRRLELYSGNLLTCQAASNADIVICQTDFPTETQPTLIRFLSQFKLNTRILLYHSLRNLPNVIPAGDNRVELYEGEQAIAEYQQIAPDDSHFSTTWSPVTGAHFDLWIKTK